MEKRGYDVREDIFASNLKTSNQHTHSLFYVFVFVFGFFAVLVYLLYFLLRGNYRISYSIFGIQSMSTRNVACNFINYSLFQNFHYFILTLVCVHSPNKNHVNLYLTIVYFRQYFKQLTFETCHAICSNYERHVRFMLHPIRR